MVEVTNVQTRPAYSATKKGAKIGVGVGTLGAVGVIGGANLSRKVFSVADFATKRMSVEIMRDTFTALGKDLSKTTVSKLAKSLVKKNALKQFTLWTAVGTGIGLAVDTYKNHKANN